MVRLLESLWDFPRGRWLFFPHDLKAINTKMFLHSVNWAHKYIYTFVCTLYMKSWTKKFVANEWVRFRSRSHKVYSIYSVIKLNAHILKLNTMFYYLHLIQYTRVSSPADMTARISYSDMTVLTLHNKRTRRVKREWRYLFSLLHSSIYREFDNSFFL